MTKNTAPKFTQEFGAFVCGCCQGHTLILASEGYADLTIASDAHAGGYSVRRRGDADVVANFRTQREARAYAVAAREIDARG